MNEALPKDTRSIHVVMGTTGEYSDRSEWPVKAFSAQEKAEALVKELVAWAVVKGVHSSQSGRGFADYATRNKWAAECPDPNFQCDYTGTNWYTMEVPYAE